MSQVQDEPKRHSRKGLFIPFILVGIALVLWTGWWFFLAHEVKTRMVERLDRLEASGWTVKYDGITITGWPAHVRIALKAPEIIAPSGQGIRAPEIAAEANSYNPGRWVIATGQEMTLVRADRGDTKITADAIRMSLTGLRQRWPNVAMEMVAPRFTPATDAAPFPLANAELVQLHMRPHVGAGVTSTDDVDVLFRIIKAKGREGGPVQGFAQSGELTLQVEAVIEDATTLRQPANEQGLLALWTDKGGRFVRVRGEMQAGVSHALITSPELKATDNGYLEGDVNFKARKPLAAIVGIAGSNLGLPTDRAADAQATTGTSQGGEGEDGQDVDLSVSFRNGRTYLGPFDIAPAPRVF